MRIKRAHTSKTRDKFSNKIEFFLAMFTDSIETLTTRKGNMKKVTLLASIFLSAILMITHSASALEINEDSNQLKISNLSKVPEENVVVLSPAEGSRGIQIKGGATDFPSILMDRYNSIYLNGNVFLNGKPFEDKSDNQSTRILYFLIFALSASLFLAFRKIRLIEKNFKK